MDQRVGYQSQSIAWISALLLCAGAPSSSYAVGSPASAGVPNPGFDCVVEPGRTLKIGSPVRGILSEVLVTRGAAVEKGQPLARLESSVEASTVELNRMRASDTSAVNTAKERLELANKNLARSLSLQLNDVVSQKLLDELSTVTRVAENELAQAKLQRELARLELARSRAILDLRTVRSPIAGVVTERQLSGGEFVSEDVEILTLVELDPLHVETFVPQDLFGTIKVGETAIVALTVPAGERRDAVITVVDPVFDAASGTFGIRLELPNPERTVAGGVRCTVHFAEQAKD